MSDQWVLRTSRTVPFGSNLGDMNGDDFRDYAFVTILPSNITKLVIYYGGPGMDDVWDEYYGSDTGSTATTLQPLGNICRADLDADGVSRSS